MSSLPAVNIDNFVTSNMLGEEKGKNWEKKKEILQITVLDGAESLKGSHRLRKGRIFLCASLFNKYLSNEPSFGRIHLAA